MLTLLYIVTIAAFFFVIFTLIMGAKSMANKSEDARAISNKWMQRRVMGQAAAVGLLLLTIYVKTKGV